MPHSRTIDTVQGKWKKMGVGRTHSPGESINQSINQFEMLSLGKIPRNVHLGLWGLVRESINKAGITTENTLLLIETH